MEKLDFYVDFNIEIPIDGDEFNLETEQRLRDLASHHSDLIGASVSLESIVKTETPYLYQVRIVLYKRPEDIVIVEKGIKPMNALKGAIDALEEKVRASREKRSQQGSRRAGVNDAVSGELSAEEVYATYFKNKNPEELLNKDRTEIASRLMVQEGLVQEAAYFAADQILRVAEKNTNQSAHSFVMGLFSMSLNTKELYQEQIEIQLERLRIRIVKLEKQIEKMEAGIKVRHDQKISPIRGYYVQTKEKLEVLKEARQEVWFNLRNVLDEAIQVLEEAVNIISHNLSIEPKNKETHKLEWQSTSE